MAKTTSAPRPSAATPEPRKNSPHRPETLVGSAMLAGRQSMPPKKHVPFASARGASASGLGHLADDLRIEQGQMLLEGGTPDQSIEDVLVVGRSLT
jgi:hypothetical protein